MSFFSASGLFLFTMYCVGWNMTLFQFNVHSHLPVQNDVPVLVKRFSGSSVRAAWYKILL